MTELRPVIRRQPPQIAQVSSISSTMLDVIVALLPALGIGLNLRAILKNETMPFLLVGFLLVAYFQISIVGVAMFGLVFALIYMQMNQKEDASYGG